MQENTFLPACDFFKERELIDLMDGYLYSDRMKDLNGFRPRGLWIVDTPCKSITEARAAYKAAILRIGAALGDQVEWEMKERDKNLLEFKAEIESLREQLPKDRVTAQGTQTEDQSRFCALKVWIDTRDDIDLEDLLIWDGSGLDSSYLCHIINVDYAQAHDLKEWLTV